MLVGVAAALEAAGIGPVHAFETLGSTNERALELADAGAPHGTVVVADAQTAGRGRGGRAWYSPPGRHLYLSVIWRFDWPAREAPPVTLEVAVALARAVETFGLRPGLKWPNDLLLGVRKAAGVLTELRTAGDRVDAIVAGIGVDVGDLGSDAPPEVRAVATTLSEAAGRPVAREAVAGALGEQLIRSAEQLRLRRTFDRAGWLKREVTLGRPVRVEASGEPAWRGRAVDLDPDGVLVVSRGDERVRVTAGDVIFE